jgi:hypothetical protein
LFVLNSGTTHRLAYETNSTSFSTAVFVILSSYICTNAQYVLLNNASGKVLDLPTSCQGSNGCQLQQWDWNTGENQQWYINALGNGYYQVANVYSSKALDLTAQCQDSNGCRIQQWDWGGGANQQWAFTLLNTGYYAVTTQATLKVLDLPTQCQDSNGCFIQQWDWNGGANQQWAAVPVSAMPTPLSPPPPPNTGTGWTCDGN